ncbi:unnamed protein product [Absidia cylindrospora]
MNGITAEERTKYGEIFQARGQMNGYMAGSTARDVLLSSNLPPNRLERIWDLSDIDKDGNLDFEEFCIAMHLTFDCINGMDTPLTLPPQFIPASKFSFIILSTTTTTTTATTAANICSANRLRTTTSAYWIWIPATTTTTTTTTTTIYWLYTFSSPTCRRIQLGHDSSRYDSLSEHLHKI